MGCSACEQATSWSEPTFRQITLTLSFSRTRVTEGRYAEGGHATLKEDRSGSRPRLLSSMIRKVQQRHLDFVWLLGSEAGLHLPPYRAQRQYYRAERRSCRQVGSEACTRRIGNASKPATSCYAPVTGLGPPCPVRVPVPLRPSDSTAHFFSRLLARHCVCLGVSYPPTGCAQGAYTARCLRTWQRHRWRPRCNSATAD